MRAWVLSVIVLVTGCTSLRQNDDEVLRRFVGGRLAGWKALPDASAMHWPYAWIALAAYQAGDDPKRRAIQTYDDCPEPHMFLRTHNWKLWEELPLLKEQKRDPQSDAEQMRRVHLRAEVWSNEDERKVVVAFGGTVATDWQDWRANFRWLPVLFNKQFDDQYWRLSETFEPLFEQEYRRRSAEPGWEWLRSAQVVGTGHSLGAGLAQRFAYTANHKGILPRVHEVYAFDASPVSGKKGVPGYEQAANGLTIYRIYNRGEILSTLRSIFALIIKPTEANGQTWIDIRYRVNWSWRTTLPIGAVHSHGLYELACKMKREAHVE